MRGDDGDVTRKCHRNCWCKQCGTTIPQAPAPRPRRSFVAMRQRMCLNGSRSQIIIEGSSEVTRATHRTSRKSPLLACSQQVSLQDLVSDAFCHPRAFTGSSSLGVVMLKGRPDAAAAVASAATTAVAQRSHSLSALHCPSLH